MTDKGASLSLCCWLLFLYFFFIIKLSLTDQCAINTKFPCVTFQLPPFVPVSRVINRETKNAVAFSSNNLLGTTTLSEGLQKKQEEEEEKAMCSEQTRFSDRKI